MAQKQIPIDSLIDNGTVDIIQSEPQFKKKNSLVYKGILSNMTTETAEGLLSTTGKNITWSDFQIQAGCNTFCIPNVSTLTRVSDTLDLNVSCEILHVQPAEDGILVAEKVSDRDVRITAFDWNGCTLASCQLPVTTPGFTAYSNARIKSAAGLGCLTIDNKLCSAAILVHFNSGCSCCGNEYDCVSQFIYSPTNGICQYGSLALPTCGEKLYAGGTTTASTLGLDDKDMRHRVAILLCHCGLRIDGVAKYMPLHGNTVCCVTGIAKGFGVVSEDGLTLTGEPVIVSVQTNHIRCPSTTNPWTQAYLCPQEFDFNCNLSNQRTSLKTFGVPLCARIPTTGCWNCNLYNYERQSELFTYSWQSLSDAGTQTVLDNGVCVIMPFSLECSSICYRYSVNGTCTMGCTCADKSFTCEVACIGESGDNWNNQPKSGTKPRYYCTNLLDFKPYNLNYYLNCGTICAGSEEVCVGFGNYHFRYVYGLRVCRCSLGDFFIPHSTPAIVPYPGDFYANANSDYRRLQYGTRISYLDLADPIGRVGWCTCCCAAPTCNDQIFPHLKLFENCATQKGSTYDYGRGWSRFTLGSIVYANYHGFGPMVYEEPAKLITYTGGVTECCYIDVIPKTSLVSNSSYCNNMDWPKCICETEWLRTNCSLGYRPPNAATIYRPHKIQSAQMTSCTWVYSHNFTGINENSILSKLPFTVPNGSCIGIPVYEGVKTTITYSGNALFTPHSMGENYSIFNLAGIEGACHVIATWSSGKISAVKICRASCVPIKVEKVADYIYRTNLLGTQNVLVEDRNGNFKLENSFYGYAMNVCLDTVKDFNLKMPNDSSSYISNDVYYYGAGINSTICEKDISTSFLLPAITVNSYVDSSDTQMFTERVLNGREGIIRARLAHQNGSCCIAEVPSLTCVQEYWTHSQATTDVSYKNSRYLVYATTCACNITTAPQNTFEEDYSETTWLPSSELVMYPVGIASKTYGENYITSTVDVGDNYVSRFYNRNNQTFLNFNNTDQVYFGSEIFTIMSGNYYFDGQGIYYLGSQSDYSQNIFTAYAIGMRFLANSSAEAYFYSEWDKSLYIYTASNTLQKSVSLADRGNILDALYSSAEQSLYILFDDNTLYIKSQEDDCLIEGVSGTKLQSTAKGAFVIDGDSYHIYNPYLWSEKLPLTIESEWLGDSIALQKVSFVDVVLYRDDPKAIDVDVDVQILNGADIRSTKKTFNIKKEDWKNQMYRARVVLKGTNKDVGNAVKVIVKGDDISIFNINLEMNTIAEQTSAPLSARY